MSLACCLCSVSAFSVCRKRQVEAWVSRRSAEEVYACPEAWEAASSSGRRGGSWTRLIVIYAGRQREPVRHSRDCGSLERYRLRSEVAMNEAREAERSELTRTMARRWEGEGEAG